MTAVKMPLLNVGPQVPADVCKVSKAMGRSPQSDSDADGEGEPGWGGVKMTLVEILYG